MIRLFFSIFLVAFLCISCHAQTANDSLKDSISQINRLWPAEKVYLHTDKPYYDVGDTIWLKAYVLDAGLLTATKKSNYLYVELYNDTSEVVRRISIRLNINQEDYLEKVTSKTFAKRQASNAGSQTTVRKDSKGNTYVRTTFVSGEERKQNYIEILYLGPKKHTGLSLRISCDLANKDKYRKLIEAVINSVEII